MAYSYAAALCVPVAAAALMRLLRIGLYGRWGGPIETYTAYSNEAYEELYHQLASLRRSGATHPARFISVVGSFGAPLSILADLDMPRDGEVVFFDLNPKALLYASITMKLVNLSRGPAEFVSLFFARDLRAFERGSGRLTAHNQREFLGAPVEQRLRGQVLGVLTRAEASFWSEVAASFWDADSSSGDFAPFMLPVWDPQAAQLLEFGTGALMNPAMGPPDPGYGGGFLNYGLGFLSGARAFERVRHNLGLVRLVRGAFEDVIGAASLCHLAQGSTTVLFTMDMTVDGKFQSWDRLRRHSTCGQRIVWLRSNTRNKSGLCGSVRADWSVASCGDWDSNDTVVHNMTVRAVSRYIRGSEFNGTEAYRSSPERRWALYDEAMGWISRKAWAVRAFGS